MASKLYDYTPEQLQKLLDTSYSYANVLSKCGMSERGGNHRTLKRIIKEYGLSKDQLNKNRRIFLKECANKSNKNKRAVCLEDVFSNKKPMLGSRLAKRMIEEGYKEKRCERCGITDWMGMPITLQLHHKDGNHRNNQLDNLEILCPNCHTQTDTYGAKNIKKTKTIKTKTSSFIEESNNDVDTLESCNYNNCINCGKKILYNRDNLCGNCRRLIKAKQNRRKDINYNIIDIVEKYEKENKTFQIIANELNIDINIILNDYKKYKGVSFLYELYGDRNYYKEMIRNLSFLEIGKRLGVTDNTIRKWCKNMNLPYKKREIDKYTDEEWKLI